MSDDRFDKARLDELAGRAALREYEFASAAPGVGGFVARCRAAWNSVATKWQVRPMIEQQSAFNAALVEWLARRQMGERAAGERDPVGERVGHDRSLTDLNRETAAVGARAAGSALSLTLSPRARDGGCAWPTLARCPRPTAASPTTAPNFCPPWPSGPT